MKKKYRYLHQFDGIWTLSDPPRVPIEIDYKTIEHDFDNRIINYLEAKKVIDNVKLHNPTLKDEDFSFSISCYGDDVILAYQIEVVKSIQQYKDEYNQYKIDMETYEEEKKLLHDFIKQSLKEKEEAIQTLKKLLKELESVN